jgi:hypothetical protein
LTDAQVAYAPRTAPPNKSPGDESPEMKGENMRKVIYALTNAGVKIISENAGEFVRNLKNESGKDIWLFGG